MKHILLLLCLACTSIFAQSATDSANSSSTDFAYYSKVQNASRITSWVGVGIMGFGLYQHVNAIMDDGDKAGAAMIEAVGLGVQFLGVAGNGYGSYHMVSIANASGKNVEMRGMVPFVIAWSSSALGTGLLLGTGASDAGIAAASLLYLNSAVFQYISWAKFSGSADRAKEGMGLVRLNLMPGPVLANNTVRPGLVVNGQF